MSEQSSDVSESREATTSTESTTGGTDFLSQLVGEGKRYKTVEDLAKGRIKADEYLRVLETENKALRESLDDDHEALDQKIRELANRRQSKEPTSSESNQPRSESLSEDDLFNLFNKWETTKKVRDNRDQFVDKAREMFGDKADAVIQERLASLGMDQDLYSAMIERNPESALKLLKAGTSGTSSGIGSRESSVNTGAFLSGGANVENHSYFSKLRKDMGTDFYKPEVQSRMIAARKKLGDDYWK